MVSVVGPSAAALWNAVWTVSTSKGISRKVPETEQEWAALRHRATALLDSIKLLQNPARRVAKPGEKSAKPGIEEEPKAIAKLMASDPAKWIEYARGMHDATEVVLAAIEAHDASALNIAGDALNLSCEACHKRYWYPREISGDSQK
jgi:cytochrome c556